MRGKKTENTSVAWALNFCRELECVRCRQTNKTKHIYWYNGTRLEPWTHTIQFLEENIHRFDVWCDDCPVVMTKRITGNGRLEHKKTAAVMASIRLRQHALNKWDKNVLPNGKAATKEELVNMIKSTYVCQICRASYHPCAMEFHHIDAKSKVSNIANMVSYTAHTFNSLVDELQKCALLCVVCHRYVSNKLLDPPTQTLVLDNDFWDSFYSYLDKTEKI